MNGETHLWNHRLLCPPGNAHLANWRNYGQVMMPLMIWTESVESGDTSQISNDEVCYILISDYINLIQSFIFRSYHSYHPSLCQFLVYVRRANTPRRQRWRNPLTLLFQLMHPLPVLAVQQLQVMETMPILSLR